MSTEFYRGYPIGKARTAEATKTIAKLERV
jgi:hypothetical protein